MEGAIHTTTSKMIALVTGANKGIGLEICRQLLSKGSMVILTARDEQRGHAAIANLQASGASDSDVLFHQLDVADSASVASLADFVRDQFGKLDVLVNNAAVSGLALSPEILSSFEQVRDRLTDYANSITETYDMVEECLYINYYGTKAVTEALIPLLQSSQSPRIVNLSSFYGRLRYIPGDRIKEEMRNVDVLSEDRLNELLQSFLNDFKERKLEENGWPTRICAYKVSKVAVSAYTRILAKKYPNICINCVHPGVVKTDINWNTGELPVEEGAQGPVFVALLPDGSPSGQFYDMKEVSSFDKEEAEEEEVAVLAFRKRHGRLIALVTGANKGIGLETCRQLLSKGATVILTARDEQRGLAAVRNLQASGASDVLFHQLDVADSASVSSLAGFIHDQFGKLDVLVNNAAVHGVGLDPQILGSSVQVYIPDSKIKEEMRNVDVLSEDRLDELLQSFLNDFKGGKLQENGWPTRTSAYMVSKVAVSAYTRILAKKYPKYCINCVNPGFVKTDINYNFGELPVEAHRLREKNGKSNCTSHQDTVLLSHIQFMKLPNSLKLDCQAAKLRTWRDMDIEVHVTLAATVITTKAKLDQNNSPDFPFLFFYQPSDMRGGICSPRQNWIAVVTGANKGIGLEVCRQLAFNGVKVILTARDETKGMEALEKMRDSELSDIIFHQLDVTDASSIASLADFIRTQFGKLDILVNNAAVGALTVDMDALKASKPTDDEFACLQNTQDTGDIPDWLKPHVVQSFEMAETCLQTNYYGAKAVIKAFIPLLQSSLSGRIINVSSTLGQLRVISNERLQEELSDVDCLTEERIDQLSTLFLKDFKDDLLGSNGWPTMASAYKVSKVLINAYTRILAKTHPALCINCVNPGFVKTDLNWNSGILTVEEGAKGPVLLALGYHDSATGLFFDQTEASSF
ncbi:unnamed protein product [Musa acuminata subsp. malaccensis]|uniref:(wild Malaysian banana) hypothetical protein n=1 Tax=Musa acuminata subsp. malaccensis TaxID=214687 RepID=A0A8D6ZX49_MUSAM|nr:unnamed protein product [Musa acuminata subsp. malaccensis]